MADCHCSYLGCSCTAEKSAKGTSMSPNKFVDAFIVGKKPLPVAKMSKAEREDSVAQLQEYHSFVEKRGKEVLPAKQHADIPRELYRVKAAIGSLLSEEIHLGLNPVNHFHSVTQVETPYTVAEAKER